MTVVLTAPLADVEMDIEYRSEHANPIRAMSWFTSASKRRAFCNWLQGFGPVETAEIRSMDGRVLWSWSHAEGCWDAE